MHTVYMKIIAPILFSLIFPPLSAGDWANSIVTNTISFNTTASGRIQDRIKVYTKCRRVKLTQRENNPVYSIDCFLIKDAPLEINEITTWLQNSVIWIN